MEMVSYCLDTTIINLIVKIWRMLFSCHTKTQIIQLYFLGEYAILLFKKFVYRISPSVMIYLCCVVPSMWLLEHKQLEYRWSVFRNDRNETITATEQQTTVTY